MGVWVLLVAMLVKSLLLCTPVYLALTKSSTIAHISDFLTDLLLMRVMLNHQENMGSCSNSLDTQSVAPVELQIPLNYSRSQSEILLIDQKLMWHRGEVRGSVQNMMKNVYRCSFCIYSVYY